MIHPKWSAFRFIETKGNSSDSINNMLDVLLNKYETAYEDLTLIVKDDLSVLTSGYENKIYTKNEVFINYYKKYLYKEGVLVEAYKETVDGSSVYYEISDEYRNRYRLFIRTEDEYKKYRLGDLEYLNSLKEINQGSDKITVYIDDHTPYQIDKLTTVLDFAFQIDKDLGIHFKRAIINHKEEIPWPAKTILHDHDHVKIVHDFSSKPNLEWFRLLTSDKAKTDLIQYFANDFVDNMITIYDKKSSKYHQMKSNITLIDIAFLIDYQKALYCSYVVINGIKRDIKFNNKLEMRNEVEVIYSDKLTVSIEWFKYIKTDFARYCLIEYFKEQLKNKKD